MRKNSYSQKKKQKNDQLKSTLLANMSHEICTLMNGIIGFTELFQNSNLSVENQKGYLPTGKRGEEAEGVHGELEGIGEYL